MLAEKKGKEAEIQYYNIYDQLDEYKFIDSIDCFQLFDSEIKCGTEVYSRFLHVPVEEETNSFIETYYTEAVAADDNPVDFYYPLRNKEFNQKKDN